MEYDLEPWSFPFIRDKLKVYTHTIHTYIYIYIYIYISYIYKNDQNQTVTQNYSCTTGEWNQKMSWSQHIFS